MDRLNKAIRLIKLFEGFSPIMYKCPAGYETIGYGHVVRKDERFDRITKEEATNILKDDADFTIDAVNRLIKVYLNDNQFAAIVSFTFNVGSGALQRSTLRCKLNRGEYHKVQSELKKWVFAGGKKQPGLVARRNIESQVFSGEDLLVF